jgi:uncharacterized protein YndB with AHSA1/START domain
MIDDTIDARELSLERMLDVSCKNVWRCWREPKLLEKWFAPPSWKTEVKDMQLRSGGTSHIIMRGVPAAKPVVVPFMTTIIEMADEGAKTRYTVRARHLTEKARRQHEKMGFFQGWEQTMNQLEALARKLEKDTVNTLYNLKQP